MYLKFPDTFYQNVASPSIETAFTYFSIRYPFIHWMSQKNSRESDSQILKMGKRENGLNDLKWMRDWERDDAVDSSGSGSETDSVSYSTDLLMNLLLEELVHFSLTVLRASLGRKRREESKWRWKWMQKQHPKQRDICIELSTIQ
jgi:hypothetical protein